MSRGELFILSAPSGAGKTTLIRSLLEGGLGSIGSIEFSVSHTTRAPRAGEVDGREYHFVSEEQFERMIAEEQFLEWAEVHGNSYGTSFAEIEARLDAGIDVVMDIDVKGAERVMQLLREGEPPLEASGHSIFIMPPSYGELRKRLFARDLDDRKEMSRRLAISQWEMKRAERYDYAIVNDDADKAAGALQAIVLEKRHRRARIRPVLDDVLRDFALAHQNEQQAQSDQAPGEGD